MFNCLTREGCWTATDRRSRREKLDRWLRRIVLQQHHRQAGLGPPRSINPVSGHAPTLVCQLVSHILSCLPGSPTRLHKDLGAGPAHWDSWP
ncbi:hypothetical protein HYQ46_010012 [Verticillium longisporum]|nr:hypothetical protein HYQ46_010012 [Verticillium longisporum]